MEKLLVKTNKSCILFHMRKLKPFIILLMGATILSFGIYNIHAQCAITEGGELGVELLLLHWFCISPAFTSFVLDITFYSLGFVTLGKKFIQYSLFSTLVYSSSYFLFQLFPPLLPNLSQHLVLASILGALFVGVGCGIVVNIGGACSADDALAIVLSHVTHIPISICYLFSDITVLLLSLTYIPLSRIAYSLITVTLSSLIIGKISKIKLL